MIDGIDEDQVILIVRNTHDDGDRDGACVKSTHDRVFDPEARRG
jgi:hypothetical protein